MVLDNVQYSLEPKQVKALEDTLKTNISVFSYSNDEGKAVFTLYVSEKHYNRNVDLLYWQWHFAFITNFERFIYDITRIKSKTGSAESAWGRS